MNKDFAIDLLTAVIVFGSAFGFSSIKKALLAIGRALTGVRPLQDIRQLRAYHLAHNRNSSASRF